MVCKFKSFIWRSLITDMKPLYTWTSKFESLFCLIREVKYAFNYMVWTWAQNDANTRNSQTAMKVMQLVQIYQTAREFNT